MNQDRSENRETDNLSQVGGETPIGLDNATIADQVDADVEDAENRK